MSDIDIKSGEPTHKVIRRGIYPLLCPLPNLSHLKARSDERRALFTSWSVEFQ